MQSLTFLQNQSLQSFTLHALQLVSLGNFVLHDFNPHFCQSQGLPKRCIACLQELQLQLQCARWRHQQWRCLNHKLDEAMRAAQPKVSMFLPVSHVAHLTVQ